MKSSTWKEVNGRTGFETCIHLTPFSTSYFHPFLHLRVFSFALWSTMEIYETHVLFSVALSMIVV